LNHVIKLVN